ncbi:amidase domain-containing protein [Paenibacillus lutrae]|uniref:amidase domain-containing protein n=1 Tax=Paenibacillus lutrae TaxID=2078573 RepID=UPI003B84539C
MLTNSDININSSYNRTGAVDFVKKYAAKPGYTMSPYTTYGSNENGGDCTNFASQVLRIGGVLHSWSKGIQPPYNRLVLLWPGCAKDNHITKQSTNFILGRSQ